MRHLTIFAISVDEARTLLADYYATTLANDRKLILETILENGSLDKFTPDINKLSDKEVAELVGELNAAETFAFQYGVDNIFVELDPENYVNVWNIENIDLFEVESRRNTAREFCPTSYALKVAANLNKKNT